MNLLIVGDVHGCYHTFKKLVRKHWRPDEELLIQVGDLINKGKHSGRCLKFWKDLESNYPSKTFFIRGNHEQMFIEGRHFLGVDDGLAKLNGEIIQAGLNLGEIRDWLSNTPLKWENDKVLITHAGIGKESLDPFNVNSRHGVLYNRGHLKRMDQLQIKGHSIVEGNKPLFSPSENAWYLDTGAWCKKYLSGLRISSDGEKMEVIRTRTKKKDMLIAEKS